MRFSKRGIVCGFAALATVIGLAWGIGEYTVHRKLAELHATFPPPLDHRIEEDGSLRDLRGNQRPLADLIDGRPTVLAFLGIDCPGSKLVLPLLLSLADSFRDAANFVAVFPNANETADRIASFAQDEQIPFLVVQDIDGALARALGIERTACFALLDGGGVLRYRGGLLGVPTNASTSAGLTDASLEQALKEVCENQWVTTPVIDPDGELIVQAERTSLPGDITYAKDVAPILQNHCQACHRPGRSAPFSLVDYDDAVRWAEMIREVTEQRRMPPWHADPRYGHFRNDRRLRDDEIAVLAAWVDGGLARGKDSDLPPPMTWPQGWSIGTPDVIIQAPKPFRVPATGPQVIDYSTVEKATTDVVFTEDRYIQAAEVMPGAPAVVHHISVYVVWPGAVPPPKNLDGRTGILGWAPGEPAYIFPEGSALWVPKGSTLVFEMHYTPNGIETEDRSSIGLIFAKERPERRLTLISPGQTDLTIPPHEPHHRSQFSFVFPKDQRLLGLMGHMHLRGKAYTVEAEFPDGTREMLLSVPRYDFYWQTFYWLKEPIDIPRGTKLIQTGWWDNSATNLNNPDPSATVIQGPASFNEMLTCWMFLEESS